MDDMSNEEIFETIHKDIKKFRDERKVIKIFAPEETPSVVSVESLCNQFTDGLLYDLELDEAYLATVDKDNPLKFADDMAVVTVIRFLHKFYIEHKDKKDESSL